MRIVLQKTKYSKCDTTTRKSEDVMVPSEDHFERLI